MSYSLILFSNVSNCFSLLVAEENLRHRVNVELENTRTTLQHIISEQFVTLQKTLKSSDHYYIEGYEYPGPTQDIDGHLPCTYQVRQI